MDDIDYKNLSNLNTSNPIETYISPIKEVRRSNLRLKYILTKKNSKSPIKGRMWSKLELFFYGNMSAM